MLRIAGRMLLVNCPFSFEISTTNSIEVVFPPFYSIKKGHQTKSIDAHAVVLSQGELNPTLRRSRGSTVTLDRVMQLMCSRDSFKGHKRAWRSRIATVFLGPHAVWRRKLGRAVSAPKREFLADLAHAGKTDNKAFTASTPTGNGKCEKQEATASTPTGNGKCGTSTAELLRGFGGQPAVGRREDCGKEGNAGVVNRRNEGKTLRAMMDDAVAHLQHKEEKNDRCLCQGRFETCSVGRQLS